MWPAVAVALVAAAAVVALGASAPTATGRAPAVATADLAAASALPAGGTPYPYATAARIGPWGFPTRFSTDYVAWRFFERDVPFSSRMTGPNGKTGHFTDPGSWDRNAADIGFRVDTSPKVGAIAQWKPGEQGAGPTGHVAYVDQVNADGSVVISEFDLTVKHGYSQRGGAGTPPVRAPRYIHVATS